MPIPRSAGELGSHLMRWRRFGPGGEAWSPTPRESRLALYLIKACQATGKFKECAILVRKLRRKPVLQRAKLWPLGQGRFVRSHGLVRRRRDVAGCWFQGWLSFSGEGRTSMLRGMPGWRADETCPFDGPRGDAEISWRLLGASSSRTSQARHWLNRAGTRN
jgi:hypothetical protein